MNKANFITQEILKEWFDYHPDGYFVYKKAGYRRNRIGQRVKQQPSPKGYLRISVENNRMREHRAIFLWHHGWLPEIIDHINGCKTDNRIENLRVATNAENLCNRGAPSNSKTGFKNIHFHKNKFNVVVKSNGVTFRKCSIQTIDEAIQIRNAAIKSMHHAFAGVNQ